MRIALLILATMIWGAGFVGTRWTLSDYTPLWSNALRFALAGVIALPYLLVKGQKRNIKGAIECSIVLLLALQLQTIGIKYTTLAKSGFLTTFYAIFTPIIGMVFLKQRFKASYWGLVGLALFGILLMCELKLDNFNYGDLMTLISAVFFSLHIIFVDRYAQNVSSLEFNLWQCLLIGLLNPVVAFLVDGPAPLAPLLDWSSLLVPSPLSGFIVLAIFSSLLAFSIQIYAQKGIRPHVVSLIFLMESVFSAFFGFFFFDERLSSMALSGAGLVLLAVALIPFATKANK
jgi:drug/metabolite transporter (DMT)-like permease